MLKIQNISLDCTKCILLLLLLKNKIMSMNLFFRVSLSLLSVLLLCSSEICGQNQKVRVIIPAYSNVTKREIPFDVEVYDERHH